MKNYYWIIALAVGGAVLYVVMKKATTPVLPPSGTANNAVPPYTGALATGQIPQGISEGGMLGLGAMNAVASTITGIFGGAGKGLFGGGGGGGGTKQSGYQNEADLFSLGD